MVMIFCNLRLPLYWVFSVVLCHTPIQGHKFEYKKEDILQFKVDPIILGFGGVLCHTPIQGHKFEFKMRIFCNSSLTLYWSIVLSKGTYYVIVMHIDLISRHFMIYMIIQ